MMEQRKRSVMTQQRGIRDVEAVPEEFGGLAEEFRDLLRKYPGADRYFSLAYHPDGDRKPPDVATTESIPVIVFECSEIEPGFVVCRRVHEE